MIGLQRARPVARLLEEKEQGTEFRFVLGMERQRPPGGPCRGAPVPLRGQRFGQPPRGRVRPPPEVVPLRVEPLLEFGRALPEERRAELAAVEIEGQLRLAPLQGIHERRRIAPERAALDGERTGRMALDYFAAE